MTATAFGVSAPTRAALLKCFEAHLGIERVWIYGSRARGTHRSTSDLDLMVDAPAWVSDDFTRLWAAVDDLRLLEGVDLSHWQSPLSPEFRAQIERDRQIFWEPRRLPVSLPAAQGVSELKKFQSETLDILRRYLRELVQRREQSSSALQIMLQNKVMEGLEDQLRLLGDFPKLTWDHLRKGGLLPKAFATQAHSSRFDGADRAIANICLKVPTGGGKTLLAAASVGMVHEQFFQRHTGLVLWVVPNEAIYRQTLKTLANRDHPYRQMLNVAGAGRVKILEKSSPLARLDVESHLCVMVLMLASASRQSKETLRFFRDRGNVHGFFPREDDVEAHWELLRQVPNLDVYASPFQSAEAARAQKGSVVKSSLGNVMRLVRPMVVIDEGHHAYSEIALKTIDGFNPGFMLELSATPRACAQGSSGSNILVDVRGTDLDEAQMIKLPIHVDVRQWSDWQSCLAASVAQLKALDADAQRLHGDTGRYIRPILLVQAERTGKDQLEAGFIHAQHVREYLAQLGFSEAQMREKTSEKDEIGDEELLSPASQVRVIITKQALQEGWDCPFAYVLCALSASRGKRALTQLVGRILRLPHVAKTGHESLDACYVFCHDATTGEVVKAIKQSLEGEGMGDLAIAVRDSGGKTSQTTRVPLKRRTGLEQLRLFLPTVTWVEPTEDGRSPRRRPLVYDSDVLAQVPWHEVDSFALADDWKPGQMNVELSGLTQIGTQVLVGLDVLDNDLRSNKSTPRLGTNQALNRAQLVRSLLDVAPNPWLVWGWVDAVVQRLGASWSEEVIGASSSSLLERLRIDLENERDRLAQQVFEQLVQQGHIEFRLRADANDYELPREWLLEMEGKPIKLTRRDNFSDIEKSLLSPAIRTADVNDFEAAFAGYLDERTALHWWHRNVARTQYGLQGWKRHKVYPDFVFGFLSSGNQSRVVLLETKGVHLAGQDTTYKQALLERLTHAFMDERLQSVGGFDMGDQALTQMECDLVFDQGWMSTMDSRYFPAENPEA